MARKRTIDPGIWSSSRFLKLNHRQRLLVIGLISNADDEGRLKGEAEKVKALIFPGDLIRNSQMEKDLKKLAEKEWIWRWPVNGETFIEVREWHTHQKIKFPSPSHLPAAAEDLRKSSGNTTPALPQDSPSATPGLRKDFSTRGEERVKRDKREKEGGMGGEKKDCPHCGQKDMVIQKKEGTTFLPHECKK